MNSNGILNFIRHVFIDEPIKPNSPEAYQLVMPGMNSSSTMSNTNVAFGEGNQWLREYLTLENDLVSRYIDYEEMDDIPELSSALDIYADDATQPDSMTGKTLSVDCADETINGMLTDLFDYNLRIDEDIWEIARTLVKYGNDFEEMVVKEGEGVIDLNVKPPPTVRRVEDTDANLQGFIQDYSGVFNMATDEFVQRVRSKELEQAVRTQEKMAGSIPVDVFEPWEIAHFRLRSKHRRSLYGFGILDSVRWIMKRLMLLEDSMLVYRLTRAPERYAFYIDVGDVPPNEALKEVKRVRNMYKKRKMIDPGTNKLDLKYNPLSSDEDFFIPVRGDKRSANIETIGGFNYQGIDDIKYFKDKVYSGIKVPQDYLNYSENGASKANLSQEDMRFARSILRVQGALKTGFKKIGSVHLASLGVQPDVVEWNIKLNAPSSIFELAQMEVRNAQLDLGERYKSFASQYWIMSNILHLDDGEIEEINAQRKQEALSSSQFPAFEAREYPKNFFTGNREAEKMLKENWEKIMAQSPALKSRFDELKGLITDLRIHMKSRR